mmetsp:Transcript_1981/g.2757  ORF Transcript_1981/g.2757 Transcript_1981/m.2757 type:complete len:231 (+) Transcript_1981:160-852(+)
MFARNIFVVLSALLLSAAVQAVSDDQNEKCEEWALRGECETNPSYMHVSCSTSCNKFSKSKNEIAEEIAHIASFFDLSAKDIDGNVIEFSKFHDQVTIVTNVASYCGRTDSHYMELVQIYTNFGKLALPVNILAFPCNQFGEQEPGSADDIKQFAADKGARFTVMEKIDVNGRDASLIYKYLKYYTDIEMIHWNFDTYFIITPEGAIKAYNEVQPLQLMESVFNLFPDEL